MLLVNFQSDLYVVSIFSEDLLCRGYWQRNDGLYDLVVTMYLSKCRQTWRFERKQWIKLLWRMEIRWCLSGSV